MWIQILKLSFESDVNFIDAIVITQSLPGDELSLIPIFKQISNMFGFFPRDSIIVVGTKINQCPKNKVPIRRNKIIETMKQHGIKQDRYMDFLTPCSECDPKITQNDIPRRQFKKFSVLIDGCQKVQLQSINQKRQKIKKRALQIQKQKTIVSQIDDIRQQIKTKQVYKTKPMYQKQLVEEKWLFWTIKVEEFVRKDIQILDQAKTIEVQVPYKKTIEQIPPFDYCYKLALEQFQKQNLKQMWSKKQ